ncbi:MAG: VWA domain-containing protein [Candidatus Binatia bacterium]|nr:VWA domain-containing protein [Candidatus Binatia bacterium]
MLVTRYTAWDGRQRKPLEPDRVFQELRRYLEHTDNLVQALDWLLRHGIEWEDVRVMGVDELLEEARRKIQEQFERYNLDRALDRLRERLEEILELERDTLRDRLSGNPALQQKLDFLDQLPPSPGRRMRALRDYEFADPDAAREFAHAADEFEDAEELDAFIAQYGRLFRGQESLDYEDAVEVMHLLERLKRLERALAEQDLDDIDLDDLEELLGVEAVVSVEQLRAITTMLEDAGYLVRSGDRLRLSPKGVRRLGQLALQDIYRGLLRDRFGGHATDHRGLTQVRFEGSKPLRFGEPIHLDLVQTLKNALWRGSGTPIELEPSDFVVYETDHSTTTSTVLLLDMSWSMSWEGRFPAAKRVALALETLIRSRFPRDYFGLVGFYTRARELRVQDLPEVTWNMGDPFTNLQEGLRLASELLDRHPASNRHIIVITDGQPTAYFSRGRLYCEWPLSFGGISMRAAQETLREVERITRKGIVINTFMLDDSPALRAFVEKMTRINKGRALYTDPQDLGRYLLVDYLGRKRTVRARR